ncbi:MAG: murein biosynthesis integral membrane protein MurJ [Sphingomonadales bacterium CG12_big_fil_rev_8_21_14_0_65_65_10]|uniref:murein biosynthesis integral membrane protein MurJ n=1 Tax=Blastomonas marina TaxID=1867408 RepID=UPI000CC2D0E0|nr:murein biosynthesis integral membrane protein MurJ [Blastomonas marina]PIW55091.1 MAG: murein biosynthesis integral membrane protein MurJ [Sphingomonadales bacterium CG12_big_fil_rev_8_21_14_0_65_65_10]WPZ04114.1 murein biosynthesis integral membrane protein MurJ [Blastomonas marina]
MSLLKNVGTIGGLTMVSRIAGMAREMIFSRVLGANAVTDAWFQAFIIPNVFRRLFAEGAFSAAFVPMFSKRLHGPENMEQGLEDARSFSNAVLSVFLPVLIALCALFELAMPGVIWVLADKPVDPQNFAIAVDFARIMFPYIVLVSLVTLFTGMLNSVSRFAPGASFPIILNLVLIGALLGGEWLIDNRGYDMVEVTYGVAWAVTFGGVIQLAWLYYWSRVEGFRPRLMWPKITPEVKRLSIIALPAAIGGGAYQINTLVQLYFLNQIGSGSVSYMNYADRLNQLPLGIIGIALSTAILPTLSRFVGSKNTEGADRIQSDAIELSMLLTIPAAVALAICATPFVTMIFQGGRFDLADAAATGEVLAALVLGLPAFVLVKVLVPNFYARSDTRTPVYAAFISLTVFVALNFAVMTEYGVVGVAYASVVGAWINVIFLYIVLVKRGYYAIPLPLVGRIARQLVAAAAMGVALWFARDLLTGWFSAGLFARLGALLALVAAAAVVYFGVAFAVGAIDRQRIAALTKKKAP